MNQLLLFEKENYIVSYWHYPFNKEGNYIYEYMTKYEEVIEDWRLSEFIGILKLIGCKNIKYKLLN